MCIVFFRGLSGIIHLTGSPTEAVELGEKSIVNGMTEHPGSEFDKCSNPGKRKSPTAQSLIPVAIF